MKIAIVIITIFFLVFTFSGCGRVESPSLETATTSTTIEKTQEIIVSPTIVRTQENVASPIPISTPTQMNAMALSMSQVEPGDYIVYTSSAGLEIVTMNGGNHYLLSKGITEWASFSPDKNFLAYVNNFQPFLLNIKDNRTKPLHFIGKDPCDSLDWSEECQHVRWGTPSWSQDSLNVLFTISYAFNMNIGNYNISADSSSIITNCEGIDHLCESPKWSFDGKNIIYRRYIAAEHQVTGDEGLFLLDATCLENNSCGAGVGPISNLYDYAWSPDSQRIAGVTGGKLFIYRISNGILSEEINLGEFPADYSYSAPMVWSPDGKYLAVSPIVYAGAPTPTPNQWKAYVYNLETKARHELNLPPYSVIHQWISFP